MHWWRIKLPEHVTTTAVAQVQQALWLRLRLWLALMWVGFTVPVVGKQWVLLIVKVIVEIGATVGAGVTFLQYRVWDRRLTAATLLVTMESIAAAIESGIYTAEEGRQAMGEHIKKIG